MRVIAGTHRGRVLRGPKGRDTRPVTDRVKVNLFNILADRVAEAVVADCFSGTGSMGIECLSRGAAHVTFAEIDGSALRLLKENLAGLGLAERASVVRHDVLRKGLPPPPPLPWRPAESTPAGPSAPCPLPNGYTLVFLDPPYRVTQTDAGRLWLKLCEAADAGLLAPGGLVVWRHGADVELPPPPETAQRWRIADRRRYGSQTLTFIERERMDHNGDTENSGQATSHD